jgi:hypothetical protein
MKTINLKYEIDLDPYITSGAYDEFFSMLAHGIERSISPWHDDHPGSLFLSHGLQTEVS